MTGALRSRFFVILVFLLVPFAKACAANTDQSEIRAVWAELQSAMVRDDGAAATALVTHQSIEFYAGIRNKALTGGEFTGLFEAILVYRVRIEMNRDRLEAIGGSELFAEAVSRDWIGRDLSEPVRLNEIEVSGTSATANLGEGPDGRPLVVRFERGPDNWRLDAISFMQLAEPYYARMIDQFGLTETEIIDALFSSWGYSADEISAMREPLQPAR